MHYIHKRVYQFYRESELNLRIRLRPEIKRYRPDLLDIPRRINTAWSIDFMHDRLAGGRAFRTFNVLDDYSLEWLDEHLLDSIEYAHDIATKWVRKYNAERPHMGLGGITPY